MDSYKRFLSLAVVSVLLLSCFMPFVGAVSPWTEYLSYAMYPGAREFYRPADAIISFDGYIFKAFPYLVSGVPHLEVHGFKISPVVMYIQKDYDLSQFVGAGDTAYRLESLKLFNYDDYLGIVMVVSDTQTKGFFPSYLILNNDLEVIYSGKFILQGGDSSLGIDAHQPYNNYRGNSLSEVFCGVDDPGDFVCFWEHQYTSSYDMVLSLYFDGEAGTADTVGIQSLSGAPYCGWIMATYDYDAENFYYVSGFNQNNLKLYCVPLSVVLEPPDYGDYEAQELASLGSYMSDLNSFSYEARYMFSMPDTGDDGVVFDFVYPYLSGNIERYRFVNYVYNIDDDSDVYRSCYVESNIVGTSPYYFLDRHDEPGVWFPFIPYNNGSQVDLSIIYIGVDGDYDDFGITELGYLEDGGNVTGYFVPHQDLTDICLYVTYYGESNYVYYSEDAGLNFYYLYDVMMGEGGPEVPETPTYDITCVYAPSGVLYTNAVYYFTFTTIQNGNGTSFPTLIRVDGLQVFNGVSDTYGQVVKPFNMLSAGVHVFNVSMFNAEHSSIYTEGFVYSWVAGSGGGESGGSSSWVPGDTTFSGFPEAGIGLAVAMFPALVVVVLPMAVLGAAGGMIGLVIGGVIGTFMGAAAGVIPMWVVYLLGLLVAGVVVLFISSRGGGGGP